MKTKVVLLLAVLFVVSIVAFGRGHERHGRKFHKSEIRNESNNPSDFTNYKFGRNRNEAPSFGQRKFGRNETPMFGQRGFGRNEAPRFGQRKFGRNEKQMFNQKGFDRNESPMFGQRSFGRNEAPRFGQRGFGRNDAPRFGQRGFGRYGKQMMRHQRFNKNEDLSYIMTHSVLLDEVTVYAKRIIKQPKINTENEDLSYIMTHSVLLDEVNVYANRI